MGMGRLNPGCCECGGYVVPTTPCHGCNVPKALTLTWQYRAVTDPSTANCSPNAGSAISTLTVALNYVPLSGWLSDYFHVTDQQYGCNAPFASFLARIYPDYWVRVQLLCSGGGGYSLYYAASLTNPAPCTPQEYQGVTSCPVDSKTTRSAGVVTLGSCSPFHLGGSVFDGPPTITDGYLFAKYDITL
jgi:hypothetical protein